MTGESSSARGGSSLHDKLLANSEVAADLRRFGQVCGYGLPLWVFFGVVTYLLATHIYDVAPGRFVVTRGLGALALVAGIWAGRRQPATTPLGVGVLTAAVAGTIAATIGYEAGFFGGAASPYAIGTAYPIVGLAMLQRRARDAWWPFVSCALAYGAGVTLSPGVAVTALDGRGAAELVVLTRALRARRMPDVSHWRGENAA
jgi:hypothetical protein